MTNSISSQRGNFSIEFAIVGVCFSLLLIFASDLVVKMSTKGKLDRLSFSAASILKERTQLYDEKSSSNYSQAKQIYDITSLSLSRMSNTFSLDRFGIQLEEMTFSKNGTKNPIVTHQFGLPFTTSQPITDLEHLSVLSSWGRRVPLYRVSVCYRTDNWFGSLIGANYELVCSESIMIGR